MKEETQTVSNNQNQPLVSPTIPTPPVPPNTRRIKYIVSIAIFLLLIVTGIALSRNYFAVISPRSTQSSSQSNKPTTENDNKTDKVSLEEKTVIVKPGQTDLLLADGETKILFGHSGSSTAVPDVVFGNNYALNDIHNINYLPIRKEVSFYNKGYFITLKNLGCNTETRFTDVSEVWVTDCSLNIATQQAIAPIKQLASFTKELNTRNSFNGSVNSQADGLLIYMTMPKLSIQNFSTKTLPKNVVLQAGSMTSYSADTPWDIRIVSGYGIDTIRYTAQEVWDKESKEVSIGALKIKSNIKNLTCRVVYTGKNGEQTKRCEDIIIEFTFSQDGNSQMPIKLASYTE